MRASELGRIIKERRKSLRLTGSDLADLAGVSQNSIYMLENGELNPTINLVAKIADVLGMELKLEVKKVNL